MGWGGGRVGVSLGPGSEGGSWSSRTQIDENAHLTLSQSWKWMRKGQVPGGGIPLSLRVLYSPFREEMTTSHPPGGVRGGQLNLKLASSPRPPVPPLISQSILGWVGGVAETPPVLHPDCSIPLTPSPASLSI